ncbi:hypothetical protein SBF1_50026 [Candidatus Desulfosporosinus infrequens]|uniref:Uncharacterized protein n=1 Tax=Candidatus Desulfosporosinus infrequens TaxID=2043169 RepID=A0A2U3LGY7_9FIRM|nr:hypothetical protein SBF1_50026 [Candidatus Desulfosporosinus infrequens]
MGGEGRRKTTLIMQIHTYIIYVSLHDLLNPEPLKSLIPRVSAF